MSDFSLSEINDKISKASSFIDDLKKGMNGVILGQDEYPFGSLTLTGYVGVEAGIDYLGHGSF